MTLQKVLWVEDNTAGDCREMSAAVYTSGRYHMFIAETASEAEEWLRSNIYEKVVVDIRLPPGESSEWTSLFLQRGGNRREARLGIVLLKRVLQYHPLDYLDSSRVGILSVEPMTEVEDSLGLLGIRAYREKSGTVDPFALLHLLDSLD